MLTLKLNRKVVNRGITLPAGTTVEYSRDALPPKGKVSVWVHMANTFHIRTDIAVSRLVGV